MDSIQYKNYEVNISDNWGWYVDTEDLIPINNFQERQYIKLYKKPKDFNLHLNNINKIIEDDENNIIYNSSNIDYNILDKKKLFNCIVYKNLLKIFTVAAITFILTYTILFIL